MNLKESSDSSIVTVSLSILLMDEREPGLKLALLMIGIIEQTRRGKTRKTVE